MAYILDNKKNTETYIIPEGSTPKLNALIDTEIQATFSIGTSNTSNYIFPTERPVGSGYVLQDVLGDGNLEWVLGDSLGGGGGGSSGNPSFNFKRITDGGTNYTLDDDDYAIEIVSDTYNTVTLPNATGRGGRVYFISRGSDNNDLILTAQAGETIDGWQERDFPRKYTHLTVMSNSVNKWYVI